MYIALALVMLTSQGRHCVLIALHIYYACMDYCMIESLMCTIVSKAIYQLSKLMIVLTKYKLSDKSTMNLYVCMNAIIMYRSYWLLVYWFAYNF